jgi:hypothetical protein
VTLNSDIRNAVDEIEATGKLSPLALKDLQATAGYVQEFEDRFTALLLENNELKAREEQRVWGSACRPPPVEIHAQRRAAMAHQVDEDILPLPRVSSVRVRWGEHPGDDEARAGAGSWIVAAAAVTVAVLVWAVLGLGPAMALSAAFVIGWVILTDQTAR